jgi:tetratricopeptide (TPR) repeat protein
MAAGAWEEAEAAFRDATAIMDSFHTNTDLQKWTALVTDETVKVFKGEPYERAMAHYYLGLLYYGKGDWGNASACFRNALLKLKVYDEQNDIQAEESAESEFAIAWYLLARCRQQMNDPANAVRCFGYAAEAVGPASQWATDDKVNADSNALLLIEAGEGPYKTPYGPNAVVAELNPVFASRALIPEVYIDGEKARDPALLVNLRHISAKKTWQTLDTIRYVKGFLNSGAAVAQLESFGRVEKMTARAITFALGPGIRYDMRYWEMLPEALFVYPLKLPPGTHSLKVVYSDTRGAELPWLRQAWDEVVIPAAGECLFWVRCGEEVQGGTLIPVGRRQAKELKP